MRYAGLIVPEYFQLDAIQGSTLHKILHTEDWLNELRKVYKENLNLFFNIRDELILRGFAFEEGIQNNFFPAIPFETKHFVKVLSDNQNFLRLNNDVTGMNHLIRRYQVQSDMFFNNISVEGIAHLVKKNEALIVQHLKDAQFDVVLLLGEQTKVKYRKIIKADIPKPVEQTVDGEQNPVVEEQQFDYGPLNDTPIEQLFYGGKFNLFVQFCAENSITKISDINVDIIEKYSMQSGVGRRKALYVTSRYYELQKQAIKVEEKPIVYTTEHLTTLESRIEYFCENDLKLILEANNISYLRFLDDVYCEQNYSYIDKKIEQFHIKLPELKRNAQLKVAKIQGEKLRNQIIDLPVYEDLMHFKWNILVEILGVKLDLLEEIDGESHLYEIIEDDEWSTVYSELYARMTVYTPIKQAMANIAESLLDREISVLKLRSENNTLEQVGKVFGVTRERVRQIEQKAVKKIYNRLQLLKVDEYIRKYLMLEELVSIDSLLSNLTENNVSEIIIRYYLTTHKAFELRDDIVVDVEINNYISQIVNTYEGNNRAIIFVDELLNKINEDKQFEVTVEKLDFAMKNMSYKRKNDIYIYKNATLPQLITYVFKNKLDGQSLEMTDENFEKLNVIMEKTFGIKFEKGKRAAVARIRDTEHIILVDPNTFVYKDLDYVDPSIVEDIETKLNAELDMLTTTTGSAFFKKYSDTWQQYGISTPLYLYSIIQHHFNDRYQIGRGNTLSITKLNAKVENASEVLANLLRRHNFVMSKTEILQHLHWPSYKLEQLVARDPAFILIEIENNKYGVRLFSSYNFKQSELEKMRAFVRQFITEQYVYTQDLMYEMEFDNEMSAILADKEIYKLYDFASILKVLMPEFRGFHQFIYTLDASINVIEDAIFIEYPEILTRHDLISFLKEKGYSENSYTSVIGDLLEKGYFYPYTSVKFINSKCLNVTQEALQEVKAYFEEVLQFREFISAYDLVGFRNLTSISHYAWEPNLLAAFAKKLGYVVIDTTKDYRYNKVLILDPVLNIKSIDELAHKLIREEYEGNYHETDVAKFLKMKKLTHAPNLPYAIKTSSLFEFNQYGFMKLLEV